MPMFYICGWLYVYSYRKRFLGVYSTDKDIVVKLAKLLGQTDRIKSRRYSEEGVLWLFTILDSHAVARFWDAGIRPRKSVIWHDFDVPDEWFWHWLRGFTDGDGCITLRKDLTRKYQYPEIRWTMGTEGAANWLQSKLFEFLGTVAKPRKYLTQNAWGCSVSCRLARKALQNMYVGADIFMDRKMKKCMEVLARRARDKGVV